MFLITVDAYSKWIDAKIVSNSTIYMTIEHLRTLFATHGIPKVVVTYNGTPFTSTEFSDFTRKNRIRHVRISPYHPSSNGLVERAVKTFKEGIKKPSNTGSIDSRMARMLFQYRITPHSTTGVTPAGLLFDRCIRSHLGQLIPDLAAKVESKQAAQKRDHDNHSDIRTFQIGDPVFVRNHTNGPTWLSGETKEIRGPLPYTVLLLDGQLVKKHIDQIRYRTVTVLDTSEDDFLPTPVVKLPATTVPTPSTPALRRSSRIRNPPDRFSPNNYT